MWVPGPRSADRSTCRGRGVADAVQGTAARIGRGRGDREPSCRQVSDAAGPDRRARRSRCLEGSRSRRWLPVKPLEQDRKLLALTPDECQLRSVNPGAHASDPDRRIFTCVGFMAGSVVCLQIARLWRPRGLACLRIVLCEHFPQEDPSGTAGRPGSSPPAPVTHSAGADHPACRNPQAEHRCSGNWTLWLCRRLGCYRRPARRPRSRADPRRPPRRRAAEGAPHGGLPSVRGHAPDASIQQPGHPAARRTRPASPATLVTRTSPHKSTPQRPRRQARPDYNK